LIRAREEKRPAPLGCFILHFSPHVQIYGEGSLTSPLQTKKLDTAKKKNKTGLGFCKICSFVIMSYGKNIIMIEEDFLS